MAVIAISVGYQLRLGLGIGSLEVLEEPQRILQVTKGASLELV
jgi:hypothetical protein